jgi:hypothetical protein
MRKGGFRGIVVDGTLRWSRLNSNKTADGTNPLQEDTVAGSTCGLYKSAMNFHYFETRRGVPDPADAQSCRAPHAAPAGEIPTSEPPFRDESARQNPPDTSAAIRPLSGNLMC